MMLLCIWWPTPGLIFSFRHLKEDTYKQPLSVKVKEDAYFFSPLAWATSQSSFKMFVGQHIFDAVTLVLLAFAVESWSQKSVFLLNVTYRSEAF